MRGRAFYKSNFVQEDDIARRDRAFADREFSRVAEEKRKTRNKKDMRATCAFFCLLLAAGGFETGSNAKTTEDDRDTIIVEGMLYAEVIKTFKLFSFSIQRQFNKHSRKKAT